MLDGEMYMMNISQAALLAAANAFNNQDARTIEALGLSHLDGATVEKLKSITTNKLAYLTSFRGNIARVQVDPKAIEMFLGFADTKVSEDDLIQRAIRAGIRQQMLETLKGINRREFSLRRSRMGLPEQAKGRIENPSEEEEIKVLRAWQKLGNISDPLLRYVTLHDETGVSLDKVYMIITNNT